MDDSCADPTEARLEQQLRVVVKCRGWPLLIVTGSRIAGELHLVPRLQIHVSVFGKLLFRGLPRIYME